MSRTHAVRQWATPSHATWPAWWERIRAWLARPQARATGLHLRVPAGARRGVARREGMGELEARVADRLRLLAGAARTSYENFLTAACYTDDPALGAWLSGCARQRRWIASELHGLLSTLSSGGDACPDWAHSLEQTARWAPPDSHRTALETCARTEEAVVQFYQELLAGPIPPGLFPVLVVQLLQVREASDRLTQHCPPRPAAEAAPAAGLHPPPRGRVY